MEKRIQKQLTIGFIFILIIGGLGYGFVDYFFIVEPTCFDGIQNQQEEGVDCGILACGIACEPAIMPLSVVSQKLIEVRPGDYDFVARINNPNSLFGASRIRYELNIGATQRTGTFFVLPGQTRFLIIPGIRVDVLADAILEIKEAEWEKVQIFDDISFSIQRKNYEAVNRNGVFSEFESVVRNNSDFDFDKVEVGIILFSQPESDQLSAGTDNIVAVNRTDIRTFLSRTERGFRVSWPTELPETIRQDVEVLTNVFENANFIRRYGTQERFQKYY